MSMKYPRWSKLRTGYPRSEAQSPPGQEGSRPAGRQPRGPACSWGQRRRARGGGARAPGSRQPTKCACAWGGCEPASIKAARPARRASPCSAQARSHFVSRRRVRVCGSVAVAAAAAGLRHDERFSAARSARCPSPLEYRVFLSECRRPTAPPASPPIHSRASLRFRSSSCDPRSARCPGPRRPPPPVPGTWAAGLGGPGPHLTRPACASDGVDRRSISHARIGPEPAPGSFRRCPAQAVSDGKRTPLSHPK